VHTPRWIVPILVVSEFNDGFYLPTWKKCAPSGTLTVHIVVTNPLMKTLPLYTGQCAIDIPLSAQITVGRKIFLDVKLSSINPKSAPSRKLRVSMDMWDVKQHFLGRKWIPIWKQE
jgi:hypothetical protein